MARDAFAAGVAVVADWAVGPEDWLGVGPGADLSVTDYTRDPAVRDCARVLRGWGFHPWRVGDTLPQDWVAHLEEGLCNDDRLMVGEVGLDLREGQPPLALQLEVLEPQWRLAQRYDRPLSLHGVRAAGELLRCFDQWGPVRAQLHAFAGSPELAREFARRGAWFCVGAGLLRKRAEQVRLLWQALPTGRTMLETDSLGLDRPASLPRLGARLAEPLGVAPAELAQRTTAAAREFFALAAD